MKGSESNFAQKKSEADFKLLILAPSSTVVDIKTATKTYTDFHPKYTITGMEIRNAIDPSNIDLIKFA